MREREQHRVNARRLGLVSLWILVVGVLFITFGFGVSIGQGGISRGSYLLMGMGVLDICLALFLRRVGNKEQQRADG